MDELRETHDAWYIFMITERDSTSLHDAGTWAGSVEKIFIGCCSTVSGPDRKKRAQEAYLIHNDAANFPERHGLVLRLLTQSVPYPGSGVLLQG
jgi:hypothetical protein